MQEIAGEYHEIKIIPENCKINGYTQFTIRELETFLSQQGFVVEHFRHPNSDLGMFFAKRK